MDSLFSDDLPSDVSLDWAIKKMNVEHLGRSYLQQTILKKAKKIWNHGGIIIDVSFKIGRRIYAVGKNDKARKDALRYTPVSKPLEINIGEEGFLSEFSI